MKVVGIIPARYDSTRFPGKPLAIINSKTMIQRVYEQATKAIEEVWVATDDERIMDAVASFGGYAVMTSPDHKCGTDRCYEVATQMRLMDEDIVINIQGDMPFILPNSINDLVYRVIQGQPLATLITECNYVDYKNPNCVKVMLEHGGIFAFKFSRERIPGGPNYKHLGVYSYRMATLRILADLSSSIPLSNLEQMRWQNEGFPISCIWVDDKGISVDTPEDLVLAEKFAKRYRL